MKRVDRALHMEGRGIDVGAKRAGDAADRVDAVGSPHRIVGDDGKLALRDGLQGTRNLTDGNGRRIIDDARLLECRSLGSLEHEVHGNREKNRAWRLQSRLQIATLQRHAEVVDTGHFVGVFGGGFGKPGVRRAEHGIVDEESRILLPVDHQQGNAGHQGVAHVEHAVGEARIGVEAHDRRFARDKRIAGGDPDGAGFMQGQHVRRLRCRDRRKEGGFRCSRIAENERNFIGLQEILDEFPAGPACHARLEKSLSLRLCVPICFPSRPSSYPARNEHRDFRSARST